MASIRSGLQGLLFVALSACTFEVEDHTRPSAPPEPSAPVEPKTTSCELGEGRLRELMAVTTPLSDAYGLVSAPSAGERGAFAVGTQDGSIGLFGFDADGPRLDGVVAGLGEGSSYAPRTGCAIAYSADGRRLAQATTTGAVVLWDAATRSVVARLPESGKAVRTLALSDDGSLVAVGDQLSQVRIWSPESGEAEPFTQGFTAETLAFVPATHDLLVAGRTLNGWSSVQQLQRWSADSDWSPTGFCGTESLRSLAATPDGSGTIAVSSELVKRFDTQNLAGGAVSGTAVSHDPLALTISADGRLFASIGREGTLRVFRTSTLAEIARADIALQVGVVIDPDQKRVVTLGREGTLHVFGCER